MTRRKLLPIAIGLALAPPAFAELDTRPAGDATIPVTYVGSNARVSLGIDNHGDVLGEILGVLGKTDEHAWIGQLWLGQGGAGGVQVDYHFVRGSREDAVERPASVGVMKLFGAADQNVWKDRKVTLGVGWEKENFSIDGYFSHAITGDRFVDSRTTNLTTTISGSDSTGPYTQEQTVSTLTRFFERAYDNGVGVRLGQFYDEPLLRLRSGFDYERGHASADQWTLSVGGDKYFRNSGFSVSLEGDVLRKSGDFERGDKTDTRGWLLLRYDVGGSSFAPREAAKSVRVEREVADESAAAAPGEPQVMRNEVRLDGDAFFEFDHADVRPAAASSLDELIAKLKSGARVSRVAVVGHTCNIGSAEYNQKLSERRADAVKRYLIAHGVAADEIEARGEGLRNPKFPNDTRENRRKNRRVDVEFLTVEETVAPAPTPAPKMKTVVEWVKEPVQAPPAWIERALRNPAQHKREVDVYTLEKSSSTTTLGPKVYSNRPPVAQNDAITVPQDSSNDLIAVLANDSDPDGDPLAITAVSAPAHGTAVIGGGGMLYTPVAGFGGTDTFTYTISDGHGHSATATVTVTVAGVNHAPVAHDDSATTSQTTPVEIAVLANDTDADGDALTVTAVSPPENGTVTIEADGRLRYVANAGFGGVDKFTYTITDGHGGQSSAHVFVTVTGVNGAPTANADHANVLKGDATDIPVLQNDTDPDGDPLTVVSVTHTGPGNAEISINPDNTVHYQSIHGTFGLDTFAYTISDGHGHTSTAVVTVNVIEFGRP